jgi:hypothetical protein
MNIIHGIYHIFDKLEDHIRGTLSKHPFIYTFVGGSGVILFWRGVWHIADILERTTWWGQVLYSPLGSMVFGVVILLSTGLFVSVFVGDSIIMSGIKKDKKTIDKTMEEIELEKVDLKNVLTSIIDIKKQLETMERKVRITCDIPEGKKSKDW